MTSMRGLVRRMGIVTLLALALLAAACGGGGGGGGEGGQSGSDSQPIVLGFINHLTGDAAVYGQSMKLGTEVALKEINDAGGIDGRPLRVIYEDDKLDANQAIAAARKLIDQDRVPVIMGSGSSSISLAIAPVVDEAGVVQISSISTNPALAQFSNVFIAMPSDAAQGAEWAGIARQWGIKEAAILFINNDYGIGVKDIFVQHFTQDGGKVLVAEGFPVGSTDVRSQLLRVKDSGAKYIFLTSHVKEGSLVLKQAQELGIQATWIADNAMQAQEVIDLAGSAAEGMFAVQVGRKDHEAYRAFEAAFRNLHGKDPTIWSDFAYDTTRLVATAIREVGTDPAKIKSWLEQVKDFPGATGPLTMGEDGFRVAEGSYELYQVKDGKWVPASGR